MLIDPNEKFFKDWIQRLEVQVKAAIPEIQDGLLTKAFSSAEMAQKSQIDAENFSTQASKDNKNPELEKEAKTMVDLATQSTRQVTKVCEVAAGDFLNKDELQRIFQVDYDDGDLVTLTILKQMGIKRLCDWCQQGATDQEELLDFLHDAALMRLFLYSGGARNGEYGRAVQIYQGISVNQNILQRLALAVALELCDPLLLFSKNGHVDPFLRFLHYKNAYLQGELDPFFERFTVWEMRNIVNCDASEEELEWGRRSLMNYRPDIVTSDDPKWRYCKIVRTDIAYKHPEWYKEPRSYDQILSGGGECGPRAWYGRFICKAFGIPTWGEKQAGHAAMARWTINGWTTCLGAQFKYTYWEGRGGLDFELETKVRRVLVTDVAYAHKAARLEWISFVLNEDSSTILRDCMPSKNSPWASLGLMNRRRIAGDNRYRGTLPQLSYQIPTVGPSKVSICPQLDLKIKDGQDFVIDAASTSKPTEDTSHVLFPRSFQGGLQLVMQRNCSVEYSVDASKLAPQSSLEMMVCTVHRNEKPFCVVVRQDEEEVLFSVDVEMPYTMGMWQKTKPVAITIDKAFENLKDVTLVLTKQSQSFAVSLKFLCLTKMQ